MERGYPTAQTEYVNRPGKSATHLGESLDCSARPGALHISDMGNHAADRNCPRPQSLNRVAETLQKALPHVNDRNKALSRILGVNARCQHCKSLGDLPTGGRDGYVIGRYGTPIGVRALNIVHILIHWRIDRTTLETECAVVQKDLASEI